MTGLLQVFSQISPDTGLPDPVVFTKGVALALSATVIGLAIAIPSLVGSGYLQRRIENYAAQLDVLLERIINRGPDERDSTRSAASGRSSTSSR